MLVSKSCDGIGLPTDTVSPKTGRAIACTSQSGGERGQIGMALTGGRHGATLAPVQAQSGAASQALSGLCRPTRITTLNRSVT